MSFPGFDPHCPTPRLHADIVGLPGVEPHCPTPRLRADIVSFPGGEAKVILQKLQVRDSSVLGYSAAVLHSLYVGLYLVGLQAL